MNATRNQPSLWARGLRFIVGFSALVVALAFGGVVWSSAAAAQDSDLGEWSEVVSVMQEKLAAVPEAGDPSAVQTLIRQAYYENYQTSGLEDQVKHALGRDVNDKFVAELLNLRNLSRDGASPEALREDSDKVSDLLTETVTKLVKAPKVADQWSRVADTIAQVITDAQSAYVKGQADRAFTLATQAYLGHYEADGFENNTIVHKGFSRVTEVEGMFSDLRQGYKDGRDQAQQEKLGKDLIAKLTEDAKFLDSKTQDTGPLGIAGFFSAFLILLREGAEALLVVAALVTYALKAGRRDQLRGILAGVVIAVVISIGLAILFGQLTASVQSGMGQELLEGITGLAAALMLIYVSNWILSKSGGKRWEEYIKATAGEKTVAGGVFALAFVSFLTVAREGAETILFFYPIVSGAKTHSDYWFIVAGGVTAVVILAILFVLVWQFGVRLPLKPFFKWTSILLALLAIAIVGGAIKELQEAALVGAHMVSGVPTVVFLGIYPTAETLGAQIITAAVLGVLALLQLRKAKAEQPEAGGSEIRSDTPISESNDKAPEENSSREDKKTLSKRTAERKNNEKKLLALAAVLALGMSLSGCGGTSSGDKAKPQESKSTTTEQEQQEKPSDPNVVGIKEIPVGDSGEQTNGPLNVNVVYFQAVDMEHGSMKMPPASESDMHFEIDVSTNKKAEEFGYPADTYMPYLDDLKVTVKDQKTGEETDLGTMMPMIASDGPHYGNNIKLKPGLYDVTITIPSPEDKFMLHTGKDSSGVKGRFWKEPLKFEFKNWQWDGQVL